MLDEVGQQLHYLLLLGRLRIKKIHYNFGQIKAKTEIALLVFALVMFGSIKTNDCSVSVVHLHKWCAKQADRDSGRFQIHSGAIRMKYECNKDQIILNEPKTGSNDKMRHHAT